MHLLVLSAFRPERPSGVGDVRESQCTFWCSVLSDLKRKNCWCFKCSSQCTFWCSVLSDPVRRRRHIPHPRVSMHLLVLSAFRLLLYDEATGQCMGHVSMHLLVLSAFRPIG